MQVVLADGFKGLRYQVNSADDDFEIYHLNKDPAESKDLAGKKGFERFQNLFKAMALQSRIPNATAKRPYDHALVPALIEKPQNAAGITFSTFPGDWPWLPDFKSLTPADIKTQTTIGLPSGIATQPFGAMFEGYFHAPADGAYTFQASAKGMATLFVHNCRIISEQKTPISGPTTGTIHLKSGWHPIRLLFRHHQDQPHLSLSIQGPGGKPLTLDPGSLLTAETQH